MKSDYILVSTINGKHIPISHIQRYDLFEKEGKSKLTCFRETHCFILAMNLLNVVFQLAVYILNILAAFY